MRKRLLLLLGCGVFVLLVVWLTFPRYRINRESFKQIEVGMTEREVESLLGGPAGNHSGYIIIHGGRHMALESLGKETAEIRTWVGDEAVIVLGFNKQGAVVWKQLIGMAREPLVDKIRRWLRTCSSP
jgi:hypothetical protein